MIKGILGHCPVCEVGDALFRRKMQNQCENPALSLIRANKRIIHGKVG